MTCDERKGHDDYFDYSIALDRLRDDDDAIVSSEELKKYLETTDIPPKDP